MGGLRWPPSSCVHAVLHPQPLRSSAAACAVALDPTGQFALLCALWQPPLPLPNNLYMCFWEHHMKEGHKHVLLYVSRPCVPPSQRTLSSGARNAVSWVRRLMGSQEWRLTRTHPGTRDLGLLVPWLPDAVWPGAAASAHLPDRRPLQGWQQRYQKTRIPDLAPPLWQAPCNGGGGGAGPVLVCDPPPKF